MPAVHRQRRVGDFPNLVNLPAHPLSSLSRIFCYSCLPCIRSEPSKPAGAAPAASFASASQTIGAWPTGFSIPRISQIRLLLVNLRFTSRCFCEQIHLKQACPNAVFSYWLSAYSAADGFGVSRDGCPPFAPGRLHLFVFAAVSADFTRCQLITAFVPGISRVPFYLMKAHLVPLTQLHQFLP